MEYNSVNFDRILVLGDLMCSEDLTPYMKQKNFAGLIGDKLCQEIFMNNQLVTVNIESPITKSREKARKGGSPNIRSNPYVINFLKRIPHVIASGANNHITDYGRKGIVDTESLLDKYKIEHIGFSSQNKNIGSYSTIHLHGHSTVIYALAQNEFSTLLSSGGYGANPYDPLTTFDIIRNIKAEYKIILFHGGKENYQYPSPEQMRICRKMVEAGANMVICQHSHCVGCMEQYKGGYIVYGTGNFLFNMSSNPVLSSTAVIPVIECDKEDTLVLKFLPLVKRNDGMVFADSDTGAAILEGFYKRSDEIKSWEFVKKKWIRYCNENRYTILRNSVLRFPRIINSIDHRTGCRLTRYQLRNWRKNLTLLNYIRCEVINEMMQTILIELDQELEN